MAVAVVERWSLLEGLRKNRMKQERDVWTFRQDKKKWPLWRGGR